MTGTSRYVLFVILALFCIKATAAPKKCIYISLGDDKNPGTKSLPRRSIGSLKSDEIACSTIKLKRDDIFFENIKGLSDCLIEDYGKGEEPIICGFKILNNPRRWEFVNNNIWRIELEDTTLFSGFNIR